MKKTQNTERKLTTKQEIFAAEYVKNGGNATAAAQVAYPNATYGTCRTIGWENMTKHDLAKAIRAEFEKQGVTLEKAIKPVVKGLEAKDKDGADDLTKQLMAHDRWFKASTFDKEDNGLQLNIENASGIEISFKNFGGTDESKGKPGSNA